VSFFVGQGVLVACAATDPLTGELLDPEDVDTAEVSFYEPGLQPKTVVADRATIDKGPYTMTYDETSQKWLATVNTAGWDPGSRAYMVKFTGTYAAWKYGSVSLKP
jgi:flagellar hook assembly protein FlgD